MRSYSQRGGRIHTQVQLENKMDALNCHTEQSTASALRRENGERGKGPQCQYGHLEVGVGRLHKTRALPVKEEDGGQGGLRATGFLLQLRERGQLSLLPGLGLPHLQSGSGNTVGVFTDHSILLFEAPERSR